LYALGTHPWSLAWCNEWLLSRELLTLLLLLLLLLHAVPTVLLLSYKKGEVK
jgi:hypothetical protein